MAYIETTAPRDAEGEVREMYQRQQAHWGYVPNYAKVFCHRPEVLARWGKLLAEIRRPMSKRRFELVTFAAAVELRHTACALAHGKALTEFLAPEEVTLIKDREYSDSISAAEQAMIEFARQVASDAARITASDVDRLKAHGFSDEEIFDIAATAAGRAFFTKLLDALGVEVDSTSMKLDASFRQPLTLGRPIGFKPVELLADERMLDTVENSTA